MAAGKVPDQEGHDLQEIEAGVLGQIMAAQNILLVQPSRRLIVEFCAKILSSIPGVGACRVCLGRTATQEGGFPPDKCRGCALALRDEEESTIPSRDFNCQLAASPSTRTFVLETPDHRFGFFICSVDQPQSFGLYQPFIHNLGNFVALVLENRMQKKVLHQAQERLECRVAERTEELHKEANQILAREQLFRALVENSPDFIARYDREFRRIYVNPAIQQLFAGSLENVLAKTPADGSPIYAPQIYIAHLRRVIETGTESIVEVPFRTAQGEMHWGHIRFVPEFGPDGAIVSVMAIGRDIHEIKENELRFRMLAENFPDLVVRFNRDYRHTYINPVVERVYGLSAEAVIGKTIKELPLYGKPEQNDAVLSLMYRVFEEGLAAKSEIHWDTLWGGRTFEFRFVPEKDA
ncbi:MAG: PAS domain-containing protein, partial [Deltaproteobacteria bacterium]|nr:PAS domain-containing protein [Deltaproteobacteria bacterium]